MWAKDLDFYLLFFHGKPILKYLQVVVDYVSYNLHLIDPLCELSFVVALQEIRKIALHIKVPGQRVRHKVK